MGGEVEKYAFIDALRGYAILAVLAVHASQAVAPTSPWLLRVAEHGARGVQLFYIASALTLCLSWASRAASEAAPVRDFYVRRLFRVLPLFWLAIVLYGVLDGMGPRYAAPDGIRWWFFPLTALCLHGLHPEAINSVVPGGWSISVEMSFYLVFPLLLRFARSLTAALLLFVLSVALCKLCLIGAPLVLRAAYPQHEQYLIAQYVYLTLLGQLPVFALGLLAYALFQRPRIVRRALGIGGTLGWLGAKGLAPVDSRINGLLSNYVVVSVALTCFTLLLSSVEVRPRAHEQTLESRVLINRVVVWVGKLSYSMYLLQFAMVALVSPVFHALHLAASDLTSLLYFLLLTCITTLVSIVTYSFIERPGMRLGKKLIKRLQRADESPHTPASALHQRR